MKKYTDKNTKLAGASHRAAGRAITPWSNSTARAARWSATTVVGATIVGASMAATTAADAHVAASVKNQPTAVAATKVVKFGFSDRVYRVTGEIAGVPTYEWITREQWAQLGVPKPTVLEVIPGQQLTKDHTSADLYVTVASNESPQRISAKTWADMKYPSFKQTNFGYYQQPGSADIYRRGLGEVAQKLTFAAWIELGAPRPLVGFEIGSFLFKDDNGAVYQATVGWSRCATWKYLDFRHWVDLGAPEPKSNVAPWNIACQVPNTDPTKQAELPATIIQRSYDGKVIVVPASA